MTSEINSKTKITLYAAICAIVTIIPVVLWAADVARDARDGAKALALYYQIDKRLDRIEVALGTKPKDFKNVTEDRRSK